MFGLPDERATKHPLNTKYKQQRLGTAHPICAPFPSLFCFLIFGIVCAIIGGVSYQMSKDVIIQTVRYDNRPACDVGNVCTVSVVIDQDFPVDEPVYVYYRLENFFQNHREYVKSVFFRQIYNDEEDEIFKNIDDSECPDPEDNIYPAPGALRMYPCGFIAESVFADEIVASVTKASSGTVPLTQCQGTDILTASDYSTFCAPAGPTAAPTTTGTATASTGTPTGSSSAAPISTPISTPIPTLSHRDRFTSNVTQIAQYWDKSQIAWDSDNKRFHFNPDVYYNSSKSIHRGPQQILHDYSIPPTNDPDMIVWMRTAAVPNFYKLYRIINQDAGLQLERNDVVHFIVDNRFEVTSFGGTKSLVLSTSNKFGGQNYSIATVYILLSLAFFLMALLFGIKLYLSEQSRYKFRLFKQSAAK